MATSSLSADAIIDRQKLKRRVTFWRISALIVLALAILIVLYAVGAFESLGEKSESHIAEVEISGVITNDEKMIELLDELADREAVEAVILNISSPGGSTVGGEALYNAVLKLAEEKPVVTSVGTMAASAGYMIAAASERIFVHRSSIVGSIGVIFQYGQVSELLDKIGVKMNEVKSSPLKAEPSPFHEAPEGAREMIEAVVKDTYQWFVDIVAEQRGYTPSQAKALADGRIFTGSQGIENGLADEIGDKSAARDWLIAENDLADDTEIIKWKPKRENSSPFSADASAVNPIAEWVSRQLGLDFYRSAGDAVREILPERLFLDGLISMMQIDGELAGEQHQGITP